MALKVDEVSSPQLAYKFTTISFDPEKYVQDLSAQCDTDAELQEHRQRIQTLSEETALCLKKNVYKNYVQFIETSREISYLEAEMYQLGHLLAEQRSILSSQQDMSLFGTQDSSSSTKPIKKDEKGNSSIESVEGLSSVLDITDLNCVCEGDLLEVELGTYLPRHKVHAFLLHDSMVIASLIPNRRGPVRYKYQSLFELENVAVVNMTSADGLKDAFKILLFPETHIYQAENSQVKNEWLEKIEECKKNFKLKLEQDVTRGDPSQTTLQSWYSSNPTLEDRKNPFFEDHHSNSKDEDCRNPIMESKSTNPFDEDENNPFSQEANSLSSEGKLRTESFKSIKLERGWLRDLPEDLDMCIAQRDFERAMELIDQTNHYLKENSSCQALKEIKVRVDRRVKQLVEALIQELDCSRSFLLHVGPRATRRAVSLLVRLGRAAEACDLFLRNRSEAIKHNLRQLKIEGATSLYIAKLSGAFFSSLIDTGREFERVFANNKGFSSAFVVWANSELQTFVSRFSCQVFRREMDLAAIGVCVGMAKKQCEKLHEIGLDLTFSMQQMLLRDLVEALLDTRDQLVKLSRHRAMESSWTAMDFKGQKTDDLEKLCGEMESLGIGEFPNLIVGGCRVELSSATMAFTKGVLGFMADGLTVNTPQLQTVFVNCIADLFESQVVMFDSILKSGRFVHQHEFILKNASFVLETVLRGVKKKLKIGAYPGRFFELQGELKRLQAITPSNDPPEADGQASR